LTNEQLLYPVFPCIEQKQERKKTTKPD